MDAPLFAAGWTSDGEVERLADALIYDLDVMHGEDGQLEGP